MTETRVEVCVDNRILKIVSRQEIQDKMGSPYEIHSLPDGGATWHYHEYPARRMSGAHATVGAAGQSACGEYVLRFDQLSILREWSKKWESVCK